MCICVLRILIWSKVVTVAFVPSKPSLLDEVVRDLIRNEDSSYSPKFLSFCVSLALSPLHITPRTVVMLEIANRASEDRCLTPGPVNSTMRSEATVFLFSCCKMYKITSFPPIPGFGDPTKRMLTDSGTLNQVSPVTRGSVTSAAPNPMARHPRAPEEHVCESDPMINIPG